MSVLELGLVAIIMTAVVPIVLNELGELSPWLAEHLIRWTARQLPEPYQNQAEEEWLGLIDETPGKVTKLLRAVGIAVWTPSTARALRGQPSLHLGLWQWLRQTTTENTAWLADQQRRGVVLRRAKIMAKAALLSFNDNVDVRAARMSPQIRLSGT